MNAVEQARGREYGEVAMSKVKLYLFGLEHAERLAWLAGFWGYCAGASGGLVGREAATVLLESIAEITDDVGHKREQ